LPKAARLKEDGAVMPIPPEPMDRRTFLRRSASAAAGLSAAGALLAACARPTAGPAGNPASPASTAVALPRPDQPVSLPLFADNPAVAAAGPLEAGPLRIYEWKSYLYDDILEEFQRRTDREVVVETFTDMEAAVTNIRSGPMKDFDVFFPSIAVLGQMVQARMLQPLNHDLLPNMQNLWPFFDSPEGPFYDVGARYTVPYTVYGTGMAWRKDLLPKGDWPTALDNPYDAFWRRNLPPKVGVYDNYREALGMALLRNGIPDVNTGDPSALAAAADALIQAAHRNGVELGDDGAYKGIPEGEFTLHQSWSGDILSANEGTKYADTAPLIGFHWPPAGVVGVDLTGILANGSNPRLAHAFVDFLMDPEVAWENYSWNGYQPPVTMPHGSQAATWKPPVAGLTLRPSDLDTGQWLLPLEPSSDAVWHQAWERVRAVAKPED
jgi:spermidine/putrescine transport system substrate-binding protein